MQGGPRVTAVPGVAANSAGGRSAGPPRAFRLPIAWTRPGASPALPGRPSPALITKAKIKCQERPLREMSVYPLDLTTENYPHL